VKEEKPGLQGKGREGGWKGGEKGRNEGEEEREDSEGVYLPSPSLDSRPLRFASCVPH
jgi:hypothetical protein